MTAILLIEDNLQEGPKIIHIIRSALIKIDMAIAKVM